MHDKKLAYLVNEKTVSVIKTYMCVWCVCENYTRKFPGEKWAE